MWVFFMRQMQGGGKGGGLFSFGKSKARMLDETKERVTFADVAGCDEAKDDTAEADQDGLLHDRPGDIEVRHSEGF